jgi:hypothetical protein
LVKSDEVKPPLRSASSAKLETSWAMTAAKGEVM